MSELLKAASRWVRGRAVWVGALVMGWAAALPVGRIFLRTELSYNEGWNVYNASIVAHHGMLYPVRSGWTTVNYPMLSFVLMAMLHRVTHEYLFTARVVSLLSLVACSVLVGAVVRGLGGSRWSAGLSGLYCMGMFCADAAGYVGVDDPQMLALAVYVLGLWVYVRTREGYAGLVAVALLFVVGGSIKHNPIAFPLAVLVDVVLRSRRRAVWFAVWGVVFAGISVALQRRFGGPYFLSQMTVPRVYDAGKIPMEFVVVFGPVLLPTVLALAVVWRMRGDVRRRIVGILLCADLVAGGYMEGGRGVSINCLFSALLAVAMSMGLLLDEWKDGRWRSVPVERAELAAVGLFAWLVIPLLAFGGWNPVARLREDAQAARDFDAEVKVLAAQPGPGLCESLLRCYFAGKPYVYDPFNATRLIHFGRLDAGVVVEGLQERRYGAVQLDEPLTQELVDSERFDPALLRAIGENYGPAMVRRDGEVWLPRAR